MLPKLYCLVKFSLFSLFWFVSFLNLTQATPLEIDHELARADAETKLLLTQGSSFRGANSTQWRVNQAYKDLLRALHSEGRTEIDSEVTSFFKNLLSLLHPELVKNLELTSAFNLISWIKQTEPALMDPLFIRPPKLNKVSSAGLTPLSYEYDPHSRLLQIELHQSPRKITHQVIHTLRWASWISLTPRQVTGGLRPFFDNELRVMNLISTLQPHQKLGLMSPLDTHSHLINIPLYSEDLFSSLQTSMSWSRLSEHHRLNLVLRASQGLAQLHKLGLAHFDIKPENFLISLSPDLGLPMDMVLMDFEFAVSPSRLITEERIITRPSIGSFEYLAPEALESLVGEREDLGWPGQSIIEKQENAFKSDVFSFGTIAFILLKSHYPSWFFSEECWAYSTQGDLPRFHSCLHRALQTYETIQARTPEHSHLDLLLEASVRRDPSRRISAQTFLEGLQWIKSQLGRTEVRIQMDEGGSDDSDSEELGLLDLSPRLDGLRREQLRRRGVRGEYFLSQHSTRSPSKLSVIFKDKDASIRTLDLNPRSTRAAQIHDELQFLIKLGFITRPLVLEKPHALRTELHRPSQSRFFSFLHFITCGCFKTKQR